MRVASSFIVIIISTSADHQTTKILAWSATNQLNHRNPHWWISWNSTNRIWVWFRAKIHRSGF